MQIVALGQNDKLLRIVRIVNIKLSRTHLQLVLYQQNCFLNFYIIK